MSSRDLPAIRNIKNERQLWEKVPDINKKSSLADVKRHAQVQKADVERTKACITEVTDYVCLIREAISKLTQQVTSRIAENNEIVLELAQSLQPTSMYM